MFAASTPVELSTSFIRAFWINMLFLRVHMGGSDRFRGPTNQTEPNRPVWLWFFRFLFYFILFYFSQKKKIVVQTWSIKWNEKKL